MTDKQIIIDNVDVSGCEFLIISNDRQLCRCIKLDLFGGIEFVENAKFGNCKDNLNCYYKQHKHKEQECEELKSRLNCRCFEPSINNNRCISYNRIAEDYERDLKQLDQLKAENEQLKSVRDSWISKCEQETKIREFCQNGLRQLKVELEQEKAVKETYLACYKAKHEDIEGTLFKLKQALAEIKEIVEPYYTISSKDSPVAQILQKISECEVE